jgi:hypothetical protein
MFDIPTLIQLPLGLGIGIASVIAPWLLRPFLVVAATLLCVQGGLLYAAGGPAALTLGLSWLTALARDLTIVLIGIGVGRLGAAVMLGRS